MNRLERKREIYREKDSEKEIEGKRNILFSLCAHLLYEGLLERK